MRQGFVRAGRTLARSDPRTEKCDGGRSRDRGTRPLPVIRYSYQAFTILLHVFDKSKLRRASTFLCRETTNKERQCKNMKSIAWNQTEGMGRSPAPPALVKLTLLTRDAPCSTTKNKWPSFILVTRWDSSGCGMAV